ncbi:MAG: T9SS type A sorting domain-containing protein [Bacteroidetes bacterium]|nr:T9SS type A sorting domain-containing protein [Bacteroidota bacterium]
MTNDNGILTFDFPGCNLPPDSLDYAASCGYIRFKVNAFSAISNNTVVTNSASIYFNFNDPFITNEVFNTMVYSITGKEEILSIIQHAKVNPNPFSDETIISFPNPDQSKFTISIKSMTGEEVANYITFLDEIRILGANLAPGIYIAELSSHKTTFHSKLLVH